ncbi:23S ribosomal RNA methyltransferase Erm [Saccharopolyspora sp. NPDC000359]|uniref:23S ribosomal RNA methyltransferase Erm n=1 Tax=Saccharopolyspora sp. NPDC000359 TaxID=3154251 RepID=UPI0033257E1C
MSTRRRSARDHARRELGQNFLVDEGAARHLVDLLEPTQTPVVELGAGSGAITRHLVHSGREVVAVELDPHWANHLREAFPRVRVVRCDMLDYRFPSSEHAVIGNLPFGLTTSMTRRLLAEESWSEAVLLVQWEVARKRAKATNQLNAQWAPWYEFHLHGKVPARSFRPQPAADGGVLKLTRRPRPLLPLKHQRSYQEFVEAVFTGRGRGMTEIVRNATGHHIRDLPPLPKDLPTEAWPRLYTRTT